MAVDQAVGNSFFLEIAHADVNAQIINSSTVVFEAHFSESNRTFNINDFRRQCRPIFTPTDKTSDNCVLAVPIFSTTLTSNRLMKRNFEIIKNLQHNYVQQHTITFIINN